MASCTSHQLLTCPLKSKSHIRQHCYPGLDSVPLLHEAQGEDSVSMLMCGTISKLLFDKKNLYVATLRETIDTGHANNNMKFEVKVII